MNVAAIKLACWLTTIGIAFALAAFVYDFHSRRPEFLSKLDDEYVIGVLKGTRQKQTVQAEHLDSRDVMRAIQGLNWTGKEAPVEPAAGPQKPLAPVRKPIKEILALLLIHIDAGNPQANRIFVRLLTPPPPPRASELTLATGEPLPAPNGSISVGKITVEAVEFVYDDGEVEELEPVGNDPLIVIQDEGGVRYPVERRTEIPTVDMGPFRPAETTLVRKDVFLLGTEDSVYLAENYPEILTRDLRYKVHIDPKTGRRGGIEIQTVRPGSIAERHGAQPGDIVKSINGHSVSSDQEAMSFVRNNADKYTVWEVEILRLGRTVTITYQSPR